MNGLERGGSWSELSELLQSLSAGALPEEVMRRVQKWADSYGRFTLEQGILISGTNEELDMLFHLPGVARCLQSRLGSNSYRVARERVSELIHAMREAGYPPRVDPSLRVGTAGRIAGDAAVLGECLYALLLLRSTNEWMDPHDAAEAVRQLEIALGPDMVKEIARRALDAGKGARNPERQTDKTDT